MNAYLDPERNDPDPRAFPWTTALYDETLRYYDFVRHPELIPQVLEDFYPFNHQPAIQFFYEMVTWLNGAESCWQTSDSAFRGPQACPDPEPFGKALWCGGCLTVLAREVALNTFDGFMDMLLVGIEHELTQCDQSFELGVIAISESASIYTALLPSYDPRGIEIPLSFFAWGDTVEETFENLGRVFRTMDQSLRKLSREVLAPRVAEGVRPHPAPHGLSLR